MDRQYSDHTLPLLICVSLKFQVYVSTNSNPSTTTLVGSNNFVMYYRCNSFRRGDYCTSVRVRVHSLSLRPVEGSFSTTPWENHWLQVNPHEYKSTLRVSGKHSLNPGALFEDLQPDTPSLHAPGSVE